MMGLVLAGGCRHLEKEVSPTDALLEQVETCRRQQNFTCAERLLASARLDVTKPADPRLIYLSGLVAVDARNPAQDYQRAHEYFQRLVSEHVASPLANEAAVWLGLMDEMHTQTEELTRLENDNTRLKKEMDDQKAHLHQMEKRLERLKAVDLSLE